MQDNEVSIEKAWGDSVDNATMLEIKIAIQETIEMDEEHGAFWVSVGEVLPRLETHKDLKVIAIFGDEADDEVSYQFDSWVEVERVYEALLARNLSMVKAILESKPQV